jgi:hypothetical protein
MTFSLGFPLFQENNGNQEKYIIRPCAKVQSLELSLRISLHSHTALNCPFTLSHHVALLPHLTKLHSHIISSPHIIVVLHIITILYYVILPKHYSTHFPFRYCYISAIKAQSYSVTHSVFYLALWTIWDGYWCFPVDTILVWSSLFAINLWSMLILGQWLHLLISIRFPWWIPHSFILIGR